MDRFACIAISVLLLGCAQPGTTNPFGRDAGSGLAAGSSSDGTTTATSDGSSAGEAGGDSDVPSSSSESGASSSGSAAGESGGPSAGDTGIDTDTGASTAGDADSLPFTLDEVVWLYPNIADWPETITMSSVTLEGEFLCLNHDIAAQDPAWPIVLTFGTTEVVGNAWVFIEDGGQWYAATWEWLRPPGQTCKYATAVDGNHIKISPFAENSGWVPTSGQSYYFMVSGLIRNPNYSNVIERSNIVEYVWP